MGSRPGTPLAMTGDGKTLEGFGDAAVQRSPAILSGLCIYAASTAIVGAGLWFGHCYVTPAGSDLQEGVFAASGNWDGRTYAEIAANGYAYDPLRASNVAFFPAYPLTGRVVSGLSGLSPEVALLLVSNLCYAASLAVFFTYTTRRQLPAGNASPEWTCLAYACAPATFFFRMQYSEGLFLLVTALALLMHSRRAPVFVLSLLAGLGSACRPVGLCLVVLVVAAVFRSTTRPFERVALCALYVPVGVWGLAAYMAYQWLAFGEPFAFSHTQENFASIPGDTWLQRTVSTATFAPVWGRYIPWSSFYWERSEPNVCSPLFSLEFINPVYWVGTLAVIAIGWRKGIIDAPEALLGIALLMVPYWSHGHRSFMMSEARYAAAALPAYLVIGYALERIRPTAAAMALACSAYFLGTFAAMFAAGYRIT